LPTLFRAFAQGQFFDSFPSHLPAIQKTARRKKPIVSAISPPPNFSGCRPKKHFQRSALYLRKVHSYLISLSSASLSKSDLSVRFTIPLLIIHFATSSNFLCNSYADYCLYCFIHLPCYCSTP